MRLERFVWRRAPLAPRPGLGTRDSNASNQETTNLESPIPNPGIAPLVDTARPRISVASAIADDDERRRVDRIAPASDRLVGTLVHRLLQRLGFGELTIDTIRDAASRLVRHDEIGDSDRLDVVISAAVAAYVAICARDDVRALYVAGRRLHEVPFTTTIDGRVVRGTVDCLVETAHRRLVLLEFKTGRESPEHQAQVDIYVQALRRVFPDSSIDARLIYAGAGFAAV